MQQYFKATICSNGNGIGNGIKVDLDKKHLENINSGFVKAILKMAANIVDIKWYLDDFLKTDDEDRMMNCLKCVYDCIEDASECIDISRDDGKPAFKYFINSDEDQDEDEDGTDYLNCCNNLANHIYECAIEANDDEVKAAAVKLIECLGKLYGKVEG